MKLKRVWMAAIPILSVVGFFAVQSPQSDTSPIAATIGKPSYPTPKGSFSVKRIIWNPRWVPPDSKWAKKKKATGSGCALVARFQCP